MNLFTCILVCMTVYVLPFFPLDDAHVCACLTVKKRRKHKILI